jgi:hypothetical protein
VVVSDHARQIACEFVKQAPMAPGGDTESKYRRSPNQQAGRSRRPGKIRALATVHPAAVPVRTRPALRTRKTHLHRAQGPSHGQRL